MNSFPPLPSPDVLIVGGGPVGLLLANLLGAQAIRTVLVEKRLHIPSLSMAIGITPPSLEILRLVGLDQAFTQAGLPVRRAVVHEQDALLGQLDFASIPSDYHFILSIPQSQTLALLQTGLDRFPSVTRLAGIEFAALTQEPDRVVATLTDLATGHTQELATRYLVGCDGHRSQVRQSAGLKAREKPYPQRYVMADFDALPTLGNEAHLFFGPQASVESFPLPGHRRRWIVLVPGPPPADPSAFLVTQVQTLTGYDLSRFTQHDVSPFTTKRLLVNRYYHRRVVLCGDAAHVMSSIGGQGMNTGFADAELLAELLPQALRRPDRAPHCFALYDRIRRQAFRVAANRAARGMWLGTRQGQIASRLRQWFIRDILFSRWLIGKLAPYFAMLTIPFHGYARRNLPSQPLLSPAASHSCHSD